MRYVHLSVSNCLAMRFAKCMASRTALRLQMRLLLVMLTVSERLQGFSRSHPAAGSPSA